MAGQSRPEGDYLKMPCVIQRDVVVYAPERESRTALKLGMKETVVSDVNVQSSAKYIFYEVSASQLPEVAELVKAANESKELRALFIRADVDPMLLPQFLQRADLRITRNVLVHASDDWQTPQRVIKAWKMGSEHDLVAAVAVFDDKLLVVNCAFEKFEVSFDSVPALKKISKSERSKFKIDSVGSFVFWEDADVHIDIDSLRYVTDEKWRTKCDAENLISKQNFGKAIATLRKEHGLTQSEIPNLTDRQMRRIEAGDARPSVESLNSIAKAHGMSTEVYLNTVSLKLA